jgi:argininosuccinate lyase
MKKPWGGRFTTKTKKMVEDFTSSLPFDKRLWEYDIRGSEAHVRMLKKQKIISSRDADSILHVLEKIRHKIQKGRFNFRADLEDIHMNIEYAVTKEIGARGGKLHTARSRNDQIALDMRLYLRDEIKEIEKLIKKLQGIIVTLSEKNIDVIMPGYTHLQKAQPVLLSHHLLAYFEMLERDRKRFEDCLRRVNVLPLGSCALAGTTLPINREYTARLLGFPSISNNSIDAVADRDFVVEFLSVASLLMIHLSRFSEELILWSTEEFGFIELPDEYSTGSSMMPQKKNPDVLELIRGKAGRVFGHLMSLLVTLKALPLAYNRDLQEDKEPLFDTIDTVKACMSVLIEMVPEVRFKKIEMLKATEGGFLNATDLAEYLVSKGVPFRESHNITGKIIRYCLHKKKALRDLSLKEFKRFSKLIDSDVYSCLDVKASINKKLSHGGTAMERVAERIKQIREAWAEG